jgi:hypothetical protein
MTRATEPEYIQPGGSGCKRFQHFPAVIASLISTFHTFHIDIFGIDRHEDRIERASSNGSVHD